LIGRPFLTRQEKARIASVVAEQEQRTAARIHVYVKAHTSGADFLAHAQRRFGLLGLHKKAGGRNVMILISTLDRRFAIWGGDELHAGAGQELWDRARDILSEHLAAGRAVEGIEACVRALGDELARRFPRPGDGVHAASGR
jgi:uncharacterized membrane protein